MRSAIKTALAVIVVAAALVYYFHFQGQRASDFSLKNWDGRVVTMNDLRGSIVALTFSYSNCSARCPVVTVRLSSLDALMKAPEDVVYLHVSIDPEMDTPESMKKYFGLYKLDAVKDRRWLFVSGGRDELSKLWNFYGIKIEKVEEKALPEGYYLDYTPKLLIIDKKGMIRHEADFFFTDEDIVRKIGEIA